MEWDSIQMPNADAESSTLSKKIASLVSNVFITFCYCHKFLISLKICLIALIALKISRYNDNAWNDIMSNSE